MRLLFSALFLFACISLMGQKHFLGLQAGVGSNSVSGLDEVFNVSERIGLRSGLTYRCQVHDYLSINSGVLYSQKGYKTGFQPLDEFGHPQGETRYLRYNMDYVSVPLLAGIHFGTQVQGIVRFGVVGSVLIHAEEKIPSDILPFELRANTFEETLGPLDIALTGEIGGLVKVSKSFSLLSSIGFQNSLNEYKKQDVASSFESRHRSLQLSLGLQYAL